MQVTWFALAGFLAVMVSLPASSSAAECGWVVNGVTGISIWTSPNFGGGNYDSTTDCSDMLASAGSNTPQKWKVTIDTNTFTAEECTELNAFEIQPYYGFYGNINLCNYDQGDTFYLEVGTAFNLVFQSSEEGPGQFQISFEEVDSPGCHFYEEIGDGEGKKRPWFKSPKTQKRYNVDHACEVVVKTVHPKKKCVKFLGKSRMMGPAECPEDTLNGDSLFDGLAVSLTNDLDFSDIGPDTMVCGRRNFHFISNGIYMRMLWATDEDKNSRSRSGVQGRFVAVRCPSGARRRRRSSRPIHIRGKPFLVTHKSDD